MMRRFCRRAIFALKENIFGFMFQESADRAPPVQPTPSRNDVSCNQGEVLTPQQPPRLRLQHPPLLVPVTPGSYTSRQTSQEIHPPAPPGLRP